MSLNMASEAKVNLKFCQQLPKVELHAHINGSISPATLEKLAKRRQERAASPDGLEETLAAIHAWRAVVEKGDRRSLNGCFETFQLIHEVVTDTEAVVMATHDVIHEFADDGVRYLELRSTPRDNPPKDMTKKSYMEAVLKGMEKCEREGLNIITKYLPSIDRRMSIGDAEEVIELALQYHTGADSKVIGVDLSGDPYHEGDINALVPLLQRARARGLKLALHIAEISERNEENHLFIDIPPDRIGHGTFLHPEVGGERSLVNRVLESKCPIEICLSSNLVSRTVSRPEDHHLQYWMEKKHRCVICTDDKGVFATTLSREYLLAATAFGLSREALWELSEQAIECIFGCNDLKTLLRRIWRDEKVKLGLR